MSASNDFPAFPVKLAGGPLGDVPAAGNSPVVLFLETNPSGFENLDLDDDDLLDHDEDHRSRDPDYQNPNAVIGKWRSNYRGD